jgi:hypothetical protein
VTTGVTPSGYIGLLDAVDRLAEVDEYTEADMEWLETGDRLDDAKAAHETTLKLREALCDGELKAYFQPDVGEVKVVPEWTWSDDEACLRPSGIDHQFGGFHFFHPRGILINSRRTVVQILLDEFEAWQTGKTTSKGLLRPKVKRPPGRPAGSGAFDDERWLREMDAIISPKKGPTLGPTTAAASIVAEFRDKIPRKNGASDISVSHRLQQKWIASRKAISK